MILPAALLGAVLGTLIERSGSIVPAMLMHTANNTTAFTVSYLLRDQAPPSSVAIAALGLFFVCAVSLIKLTVNASHELPPLAKVPAGLTSLRRHGWRLGVIPVVLLFCISVSPLA